MVDGDDALRTEIVEGLAEAGYRAVGAKHGGEALEYLSSAETPALLITDLMMPVMDGWALFQSVRRNPNLKDMPLIVLSSLRKDDVGPMLKAAGYLTKPIRLKEVLDTAERYCQPSKSGASSLANPPQFSTGPI